MTLFFPVAGASIDAEREVPIAEGVALRFRPIREPIPDGLDLAEKFVINARAILAVYAIPDCRFEIVSSGPNAQRDGWPLVNFSLNLLSVRLSKLLYAPCSLPISVDDIRSAPRRSLVCMPTGALSPLTSTQDSAIAGSDLDWLEHNAVHFSRLMGGDRFQLAFNQFCICEASHFPIHTLTAAWTGIEALLGVTSELRFRVSLLCSFLLENGQARQLLYDQVRKMYDVRSKAVHGGTVSDSELAQEALSAKRLLSRLLARVIEIGALPDERTVLFGPAP